ncbi:MAG: hypothetical protein VX944_06790 [Myxococcota bacterium]|nr:hypothetical protein [Myxococcota bacterium]MEC9389764.1 hypothetical protein [Myxococcota bacterium]
MNAVFAWVLALMAVVAPPAFADSGDDPVALAALLVQDGHWDRARSVLASIDEDDPKLDRVRLNATRGLIALYDRDAPAAIGAFERSLAAAVDADDPEPSEAAVHLYLARAHMMAEQPARALASIASSGSVADEHVVGWRIRVDANRMLNRHRAGWDASERGRAAFPEAGSLIASHVELALAMGMIIEARVSAVAAIQATDISADQARDLGLRFRTAEALEDALHVLEAAMLVHPEDLKIRVASAAVALELNRPAVGGRLLQVAAEHDLAYAIEAAEAYRRAGMLTSALYMNSQADDGPEKARQRLGLLLEAESFEAARSLESRFVRMNILDDDQVRYGLAYAHFRQGDLDRAEGLLSLIQSPTIFAQSVGLREAIAECRASPCL